MTETITVGPLILGGNVFGWSADRDTSFRILDAFVDAGGTTIDTADVYSAWIPGNSGGESETIIGEWLAARPGVRDRVQIGTKVFSLESRPGLSAANIAAALDDSLRRLQTDHIDIYFAHRDDPDVEQAEAFGAFDAAVRAGKVRTVGVSNFEPARIRSAAAVIAENALTPISFAQDQYNLVERDAETELIPTLLELGIGEVPYFALAAGFLTGKFRPGADVDTARSNSARYLDDPRNLALLEVLDGVAAAHDVPVTAVSLAWLRSRPSVAAPIASARTPEQLPALVASFDLALTDTELDALTAASAR
ncbi:MULTISPECIES: aldo/keto reductase [Microbacterium]|uniref:aldo/keto reductase n=1 Tax=Microbacterium TaxID=33882 RepID=UPI001E551B11|nr:aldo/keto reductase [Microbacterium nymphoidis]MCD2498357.1 aldo/keto reductase [Microbacterium nymphoidis]